MKSRVLKISEIRKHYSVRHAFKKFGEFVSEVTVKVSDVQWKDDNLSDIEEIVRLLGKRCSNGNLKKLSITFDKRSYAFRTKVPDCFKTLESLTIHHMNARSTDFDKCLESLLTACTGLKSLTLHRVGTNGQFLTALNNINLQRLTIDICFFTEKDFWLKFVENGIPSLTSFCCKNLHIFGLQFRDDGIEYIGKAFPNIEYLSLDATDVSMQKFALTNVKILHVKCSWNERFALNAIKQTKSIEELYIELGGHINEAETAWKNAMESLNKIRILQFKLSNSIWDKMLKIFQNLPINVEVLQLKGRRPFSQKNIEVLVSLLRNIHCLRLDVPINSFPPIFYDALVRDRSRRYPKSPQLKMFMNRQKVNSLKPKISDYAIKANCISLHPL